MSKRRIEPSANVIRALGQDLIKDNNAALIELVKNAYDADSPEVTIDFIFNSDYSYTIIINDYGHGMTEEDIVKKWLVPSYSSKKKDKYSPNGRPYLGRKGIGRFSAQILGRYFTMITKQKDTEARSVKIDWTVFDEAEFLSDVSIEISDSSFDREQGTKIIIQTESLRSEDDLLKLNLDFDKVDPWNTRNIKRIIEELRMIITPMKLIEGNETTFRNDTFDIKFKATNKPDVQELIQSLLEPDSISDFYKIAPFNIFNLFDYQIKGYIRPDGYFFAEFTSRHSDKVKSIDRYTRYEDFHSFGEVYFDIRIIDRDSISLEQKQKLFYQKDDHIGKRNLANLYNQINGINVFRNNFALKPYSEGFDWLDLDKNRVQQSTLLGHNQTMGYICIQDEDISKLIEKSARDGLKETMEYKSLVEVMREILGEASNLRMIIRHSLVEESNTPNQIFKNVEETLDELDQLKISIVSNFSTKENQDSINTAIDKISRAQSNVKQRMKALDAVLSQYEKHITLGKMVDIIIHEVRRSLQWFSDIPTKFKLLSKFITNENYEDALDSITRYNNTTSSQLMLLTKFMKTLDPLSRSRQNNPKDILVVPIVEDINTLFQSQLLASNILFNIDLPSNFTIYFDSSDLTLILANLVENSIYWLNTTAQQEKKIIISAYDISANEKGLLIFDNGPGIDKNIDHEDIIFEPGFSTKTNVDQKTGLGLSIAGEAASRNKYKLSVREQDNGCLFSIDKER